MKYLLKIFVATLSYCTVAVSLHAQVDAIKVLANGNVGIGAPNPTEKLQVEGNVKVNGNLNVNGRVMDKTGFVMPAGTILPFAGSTAPAGWVLCDGTSYAKTGDQKDLFAVIGVMYGSEGNDKFKVPDLRGTFIMGAVPNDANETVSKTGNPDTHTHGITIPSKTFTTTTAGNHNHKFPSNWYYRTFGGSGPIAGSYTGIDTGGSDVKNQNTQDAGNHSHQVTADWSGLNSAASSGKNRPKWMALNYIIKY